MNLRTEILDILNNLGTYKVNFHSLQNQLTVKLGTRPSELEVRHELNMLGSKGYVDFDVDPLADLDDEKSRRFFITDSGRKVLEA